MDFKSGIKVKKTYGKRTEVIIVSPIHKKALRKDDTMDESWFKDDFDKLMDGKVSEANKKKNNLCASFNRNSSFEEPEVAPKKPAKKVKTTRKRKNPAIDISHDSLYEYFKEQQEAEKIDKKRLKVSLNVPISTPVRQRRKLPNQKDKALEFMISPIVRPDKSFDNMVLEKVPLTESFLKEIEGNQKGKENKQMTNAIESAIVEKENPSNISNSISVNVPSTVEHKDPFDELLSKNSMKLDVRNKCDKVLKIVVTPEIPVSKRKRKTSLSKIREMRNNFNRTEKLTRSKSTSHITKMSNNSMTSLPRPPSFSDNSNHQLSVESELGSFSSNVTNTSNKLAEDSLNNISKTNEKTKTEQLLKTHCDNVQDSPKGAQQFDENDIIDKTLEEVPVSFVSKRKNKKSVAINLVPIVQNISYYPEESQSEINPRMSTRNRDKVSKERKTKSVCFSSHSADNRESVCDSSKLENVRMPSGKWRKTLSLWRQSHANLNTSERKSSSRRLSIKIPERSSNQQLIKRYTLKLQETLGNSILFEQSDDGNLSALSILDESIVKQQKLHDLLPTSKTAQPLLQQQYSKRDRLRKTSVFERSSIFYGLQDDTRTGLITDVDVLPCLSSRQIVLRRCGQQEPLLFDDIYSESQLPNCRKIGEGVYGEVFMNKTTSGVPVVLKIIPIEGDQLINGEPQKKFSEILSEVVIAMELSSLRNGKDFMTNGFVNVKKITCVQGAYPAHLIDLWELYRDNTDTENDHPDVFLDDQLFIVFELANAGQDLEAFTFDNAHQSNSAFLQTALTLAVAERKLQFEHRDLHWGNILLSQTDEKFIEFRIDGIPITIPSCGVKVTIIDFTLSRMVYDGCCLYNDLALDEDFFSANGDYQYDIYRLMRERVENCFERYEPYTNILWLHYMIDKLISGARYRLTKTKKHRSAIHDMMQLRDELLDFTSAADYVKCLMT